MLEVEALVTAEEERRVLDWVEDVPGTEIVAVADKVFDVVAAGSVEAQ